MSNLSPKYLNYIKNFVFVNEFIAKKTLSYFVMHLTVAALVAFAVTGSWKMALTLSFIEPVVQSFFYFFHEKFWKKKQEQRNAQNQESVSHSAVLG